MFFLGFCNFFRTATSQNTHEALSDVCTSSRCSVSLFDAEYVFSCNDDNDNKLFLRNSWMTKNVNPWSTNPTKWSNTLRQFVGNSRQNVWMCLTILWGWRLKTFKPYFHPGPLSEVLIFANHWQAEKEAAVHRYPSK